jgi:hypothetical protein
MSLPEWIPEDAWAEFLIMRKRIKMPLSEYGQKLAIRKLDALRKEGQDPQAVLDEAILRQWRGLFAVRTEPVVPAVSPAQLRVVPTVQWWLSDGGIITKGKSLNMDPRPGETFSMFKDRIFAKLNQVNAVGAR